MLQRIWARRLHLHLNYELISLAPPSTLPPPHQIPHAYTFPKERATQLIPAHIQRHEKRLRRTQARVDEDRQMMQVKLVDGTKMDISPIQPKRLLLQPKQEEKLEAQASIRRMRTLERIYSELLAILSRESLKSPLLRMPIWRLTRVVPNSDMRSYNAYWAMDNEQDAVKFKGRLHEALKESERMVRYQLGQALGSKFIPAIKFQYEDYRDHPL